MAQNKTWSKTGKTGLKNKQSFNWKKYLPVVVLVALVGGFFVWKSFAATKLYSYQYSTYRCTGFDNKKIKIDDDCMNHSAEAFTIRLYKTVNNRTPDVSGYKYWVQRLAGDRNQPTDVAAKFMGKSKNSLSNSQFVAQLYTNAFGREGDTKGKAYWNKQLDTKAWNRPKLVAHWVASSEAIRKNQAAVANYLQTAPRLVIIETARKNQEDKTVDAKDLNNATKKVIDGMESRSKDNTSRKEAAGKLAGKSQSQITSSDIAKIKTDYLAVIKTRLDGFKSKDWQGVVDKNYASVKSIYTNAVAVSTYSPDITHNGITAEYKRAADYRTKSKAYIDNAQWLYNETARALNVAQSKYNTQQAINSCTSKGGTYTSGGCKMPTPDPTPDPTTGDKDPKTPPPPAGGGSVNCDDLGLEELASGRYPQCL